MAMQSTTAVTATASAGVCPTPAAAASRTTEMSEMGIAPVMSGSVMYTPI